MQHPQIRGALLDVDGTLLDSNEAHTTAWMDAFVEAGFAVERDRVRERIGKGGDKLLAELTGLDAEAPAGKKLLARRKEIFKSQYLPTCHPFAKARDLVERMKHEGLKVVVATSASDEEVGALLKAAHVDDLIRYTTTSDDADRSKPDPDIVEAAIERAGLGKDALVMLGDTPYDVEAASRAGIVAIAFRSGGWPERDLAGAVAIYDDVAHLLAQYQQSPLRR